MRPVVDECVRLDRAGARAPGLVILDLEPDDISNYEARAEFSEPVGDLLPILLLSEVRLGRGAADRRRRLPGETVDPDDLLARARRLLARGPGIVSLSETPLTGRELQILQLLANGLSQERIAKELFISSKTVGTRIQRTLSKLDVHSRTEAVAVAYRQGLVRASSDSEI